MNILGIETSTQTGSVALLSEGGLVAQYTLNIQETHSERMMATVDRVLKDAGIALSALDGFALSIGPGSFTGLRIGLAAVKGLAFAAGRPVAAVPTLQALAWNLPYCAHPVCPMLDARKNEVYAAIWRYEGTSLIQTMADAAVPATEVCERIRETTVFTGEAARLYRPQIEKALGSRALFAPLHACSPSAASVAGLGLEMIRNGSQADLDSLTPVYIRRPEAEVAWEKRQKSR